MNVSLSCNRREGFICSPSFLLGPVVASWGNWGSWSQCTRTCGEGKTERKRECSSGNQCRGSATQNRDCNQSECKFVTGGGVHSIICLPDFSNLLVL